MLFGLGIFLATICGNATVWKPSEKTPLTSIACFNILKDIIVSENIPEGLSCLINGTGTEVGQAMTKAQTTSLFQQQGQRGWAKKSLKM